MGTLLTSREEEEDSSPQPPMPAHQTDTAPHGWEVDTDALRSTEVSGLWRAIRVKEGQRILFHFLNASATESVRLALPGHRFQVPALDGNPVPRPQLVDVSNSERPSGSTPSPRWIPRALWFSGLRGSHRRRAWESWSNTRTAQASPAGEAAEQSGITHLRREPSCSPAPTR